MAQPTWDHRTYSKKKFVEVEPLDAEENGTYTAKRNYAFNPVTVNTSGDSGGGAGIEMLPHGFIQLSDEEKYSTLASIVGESASPMPCFFFNITNSTWTLATVFKSQVYDLDDEPTGEYFYRLHCDTAANSGGNWKSYHIWYDCYADRMESTITEHVYT